MEQFGHLEMRSNRTAKNDADVECRGQEEKWEHPREQWMEYEEA